MQRSFHSCPLFQPSITPPPKTSTNTVKVQSVWNVKSRMQMEILLAVMIIQLPNILLPRPTPHKMKSPYHLAKRN